MRNRDSRGRIRVTVNGVRVEVNRDNNIRVYRRYAPHVNSERRTDVLSGTRDLFSLRAALLRVHNKMEW